MIVAINYSNETFKKARKINTLTAKFLGGVDKIISYGPEDMDEKFREDNSKILTFKRGDGCWLWKPYFIKTTLDKMNYGEYLIYTDSGMCYLNKVDQLILKMNITKQDVFVTETPLLEVQFTSPTVLQKLDAEEYRFGNQVQAGILILKKTEYTQRFINDWLLLCLDEDLLLADYNKDIDEKLFIAHREDQSLLSILVKKYGIRPFMDCTDYGRFPIQYLNTDYLFRLPQYDRKYTFNKSYFLLFRKSNPASYAIKFSLKIIMAKLGLSSYKLLNNFAKLNIGK
jgi:hypothetical protein